MAILCQIMTNAITYSIHPLQSTKGLQSHRYYVLWWNNRVYPQEHYFLVKDTEKSNSTIQCNKPNTQKNQWTQCKGDHQVRLHLPVCFCLFLFWFFFFFVSQKYILFDAITIHFVTKAEELRFS